MLCDRCKTREATSLYQQTVNGKSQTLHLCAHCANEMLFGNFFSDFSVNNLFAKNLSAMPSSRKVCDQCGTSYEEIMESGRVGCAHCYETFAHELARSIEKIHGKSKHIGKVPRSASGTIRKKNRLTELKMELNRAIAEQDFEQAAQLRDQIRAIEGEGDAK